MQHKQTPIGLFVVRTAKAVARAFDDALAEGGGSTPLWLVLLALMQTEHKTQQELASTIGIQGPTLTHHLNAMEKAGLIVRQRDPQNRRVHQVHLTLQGREKFHHLKSFVVAYDEQLRSGLKKKELDTLRSLLGQLGANVGFSDSGADSCGV